MFVHYPAHHLRPKPPTRQVAATAKSSVKTNHGSIARLAVLLIAATMIFQVAYGVQLEDYHRRPKQQPVLVFTFDPEFAAGTQGTIQVRYDSPHSTRTVLKADLNFSHVDVGGIQSAEPNCESEPTEYEWHIHVKWGNSALASASFAQCAKALTGTHYDPLRARGKNSEFADTPACDQRKIASYACTLARYLANPQVFSRENAQWSPGPAPSPSTRPARLFACLPTQHCAI